MTKQNLNFNNKSVNKFKNNIVISITYRLSLVKCYPKINLNLHPSNIFKPSLLLGFIGIFFWKKYVT